MPLWDIYIPKFRKICSWGPTPRPWTDGCEIQLGGVSAVCLPCGAKNLKIDLTNLPVNTAVCPTSILLVIMYVCDTGLRAGTDGKVRHP